MAAARHGLRTGRIHSTFAPMKRRTIRLAAATLGMALASCSWFKPAEAKQTPKDTAADTAPKNRLIGRIASVAAGQQFVLIQSYGPWDIEAGGILTTRGPDDRVANLRCTGEKLGQFAAADIQAGDPRPGDAVFHTAIAPATTSASPASWPPSATAP